MDEKFGSLVELLISYIKEDAFMLESIAVALQHLVKQNMNLSFPGNDETSKLPEIGIEKEIAARNIKAMSSWSEELLKAFTKVFFQVSPEKRAFLKDTIGCLALITEFSTAKAIFISSLKRTKPNVSVDKSPSHKNANMCLILKLASSFVAAAGIDPTDFMYYSIEECLQESFEFMSSKFEQLMDLLLDLKSPVDITSLRWRFLCLKTLLVHSFERTCDGENTYGFRMLNEIIVTLKDDREESSKVAYDIILETSSILQSKTGPYYEFITMIMGYLSGSSPYIKSGAVPALSILLSNDSKICNLKPDLVPEILELLDREDDIQVIEAVLGFIEVLVLNLEVRDLQNFLSDILGGLLPWSFVSQHDFESKVTDILENVMRKCGSASVEYLVRNVLENRPSSPEDG